MSRLLSAALLAALALPLGVSADDGVRELSQSMATAGGFPLTLSESGSYLLTSDLDLRGEVSPLNATALNVTADFVWIDLNGFSIIGPNVCAGSPPGSAGTGDGVQASGHHVTVVNGTVRGVGRDGLALGDEARVEGVTITCSGGDGISAGDRSLATGNQSDANGGFGLRLGVDSGFGGNSFALNGSGAIAGGPMVEISLSACGAGMTCAYCGNTFCDGAEDCTSCPGDCGACPPMCGNNVTESGETCDGTDLAGEACTTLGFTGGTLGCDPDCMGFDTSLCTGTCDPTGSYGASQSVSQVCLFGTTLYDINSWQFVDSGGGQMSVLGLGPVPMTSPMTGPLSVCAAGNDFTVSFTEAGSCEVTYTLNGTWIDSDTWGAAFSVDFVETTPGNCFDCTNQNFFTIIGTR